MFVWTGTDGLPSPPKRRRDVELRGEMVWKQTAGADAAGSWSDIDCHGGDASEKDVERSRAYICASLGAEEYVKPPPAVP